MKRHRVSNVLFPGVEVERIDVPTPTRETETSEVHREDVYVDGVKVGTIRYLARRRLKSVDFGWVPVGGRSAKLASKHDAIRRLFVMKGIVR